MFQIRKIFINITILAIVFASIGSPQIATAAKPKCDDIKIVFARGSGENLGDISESSWREKLSQDLRETSLTYDFYELGSKKYNNYQYPAVAVSGSAGDIMTMVGAYVGAGSTFKFGNSVFAGQQELLGYIYEISASCPDTKFILGGYSQGAMLISGLLNKINPKRIIYVATFGDPKLYLPEGAGMFPDACFGKNLSNYRINVADCRAYEGILGSYRPYHPQSYKDKVGTWCNHNDIMCSSGKSISDHTSYVSTNLYEQAAHTIMTKLHQNFPDKVPDQVANKGFSTHDLAILVDSTGSMNGIIDSYKNEAKRLAKKILDQGGRVALFEYRDLAEGFTTQKLCNFGATYEEFVTKIEAITASDGGDRPESALSGALHVMSSLKWQVGATKSIILLTDADYHNPDRDGTDFETVVKTSLEIDPVNIYVMTRPEIAPYYETLTSATNGRIFDVTEEIELSTEVILKRPNINFPLSEYQGTTGEDFTFLLLEEPHTASEKYTYEWDLDNDGIFEKQSSTNTINQRFNEPFTGFIQAKVTNTDGNFSTASAKITVVDPNKVTEAAITSLESKTTSRNTAEISFSAQNADSIILIIDNAIIGQIPAGQTSLKITELTQPVTVTLVPYNREEVRGQSRSINVAPKLPRAPRTGENLKQHFNTCDPLGNACLNFPNLNGSDFHNHTYIL